MRQNILLFFNHGVNRSACSSVAHNQAELSQNVTVFIGSQIRHTVAGRSEGATRWNGRIVRCMGRVCGQTFCLREVHGQRCKFSYLVGWLTRRDNHNIRNHQRRETGPTVPLCRVARRRSGESGRSTVYVAVCSQRVLLRVECVRQAGRTVVSTGRISCHSCGLSRCGVQVSLW